MWGADDPCDRMPMVWPDMKFDPQRAHPLRAPGQQTSSNSTRRCTITIGRSFACDASTRRCVAVNQVRGRGRRSSISGIFRSDEVETLFVGLNRSDEPYYWLLRLKGELVTPVISASGNVDDISIDRQSDETIVIVPPLNGVVLELNPDH